MFFPLPITYRHDYWPLNCKQCKPNRQKSHRFSLASESLVPVYGMNIFYRPTKNQSTLTLFNQAPQNVETKIEFPWSEFHCQMANKRNGIFETSKFEKFHIINRPLEWCNDLSVGIWCKAFVCVKWNPQNAGFCTIYPTASGGTRWPPNSHPKFFHLASLCVLQLLF